MNYLRALAIGTACSAAIVAAYLALREPLPPPQRAPAVSAAPAAIPIVPAAMPAPLQRTAPATPVRAGIARAFPGMALTRTLLERLAAGEVAPVAAALAAGTDAASTVELFDLAALCAREGGGANELAAGDERAALEPPGIEPATRATVAALIGARHAWADKFRAGCAAATFDAAAIRARLAAAAARGDATSLERLATLEARPLERLMSAALLGNARAAFRLALATLPAQASAGRSWLEIAAKGDPDAGAYLGACLLAGCAGAVDAPAARLALESAARSGSLYALGLLASADAPDGARRWVRADALVAPVAPRDLGALELDSATEYAWSSLAATLAEQGCFGFEFALSADALETRLRFDRTLRAGELAAARTQAQEFGRASLGATRHALGCD